jgi:hypothetical protein
MNNNNQMVAATLAAGMMQSVAHTPTQAVQLYHQVLDELAAEHDKRLQARHVPGFQKDVR